MSKKQPVNRRLDIDSDHGTDDEHGQHHPHVHWLQGGFPDLHAELTFSLFLVLRAAHAWSFYLLVSDAAQHSTVQDCMNGCPGLMRVLVQ